MTVFAKLAAASAALGRLRRALRVPRPGGQGGSPRRSETVGATLGPYRIERELGRGSLGIVYLAHDRRTGRQVALKTVRLGRAGVGGQRADAARARFLAEARTAAGLQHPNIVDIFDADASGDIGFIAMERVDGIELSAHALPGRLLPVATVLRIALQGARALAHAHRQGVVHRDVKPANLLLLDAARGAVKLTDFGIARVAEAGASWRTRTGQVLGTPAFMSPEQMAGREVDGRTDLYALGVVLFQLLTGALPHSSESMGGLMHAIAHRAAPDVRSLRPELPESLAHIVALALQTRPQLRYADGDQMADDLAAVLESMTAE